MTTPKKIDDGGPAFQCKWCEEVAVGKTGRIYLCAKHLRFARMKYKSAHSGKYSPPYSVLEKLVPEGMICPICERMMNWFSKDGRSSMITLQHDRDGSIRLMCHACNTRHAKMPGDSFYSVKKGNKYCPGCKSEKAISEFPKDRSGDRWMDTYTYCKGCGNARANSYRARNKDKMNEKRRAYYHMRKASGNPIPRTSLLAKLSKTGGGE